MKKLLHLILALLILLSCSKEKEPTDPQGGNGGDTKFEAKNWDGQKRGDIFYEIFVRSFADSDGDGIGDIGGITQKLDYLNDLGVSGIWLTPIHPSPSYHGYDVDDFMSIDPKYGTMSQFEAMISKASSLGIKVVLDLVINHTSKNHPWFKSAISSTDNSFRNWYLFASSDNVPGWISSGMVPMTNSYYSGHWHSISSGTTGFKYMGMFSDWMPDLNYGEISQAENSPAFKEMVKTAEFWLSKGVYGFRLDAVKHIYQSEDSDENPRFLEKFYNEVKKKESKVYMVGENLTGDYNKVAPYYKGLPALFNFDAWYKLIYVIENSHAKWYPKDIKEMETKFRSVRGDAINATKLSNHDEDRTMSRLNNDISKAKIAASILLTVSGSPYLYYGEEIGMRGMKGSDDRNVREPFLWSPYSNDTYRTKWHTPLNSTEPTVMPVSLQQENKESILNHYKRLIKLRNTYPSLAKGSIDVPQSFDIYPKQIMAFYRELQGERLLVVHNVSSSISTYIIDHSFKKGVAEFGGVTYVKINESTYSVTMPAYSSVIFEL
jgi:alpha-amylase